MVFNLFKKSKTDDAPKSPDNITTSSENMVFENGGPGVMTIDDVFFIKGRGTVVTGLVESGTFEVGQKIVIQTTTGKIETTIAGIETFHERANFITVGTAGGLVLPEVNRETVRKGDVISAKTDPKTV